MTHFALTAERVFDGEPFLENMAVVIEEGRVLDLVPDRNIPKEFHLGDGILAPGFVDVQVNGGGGALLNAAPTLETIRIIAGAHRKHGTVGLLPTVITDTPEVIGAAVRAVQSALKEPCPGVLGIHIEGPFLDIQRKGAHDPALIRKPTEQDINELCSLSCGKVMVTLAPNIVSLNDIQRLKRSGIHVSLGHSDANHAQATAALNAGAQSFTHLFNAMSQLTPREPGMVGAALADFSSFIGVIADGHHVHDETLKLAFASTNHGRFMLVSDAMPPAAGGPATFDLQGRKVTRKNDRLTLEDGTLAGSCLTMDAAVRHSVSRLALTLESALQMASRNPARFLGCNDLGTIAPGSRASLVHLTNELTVAKTWIDGQ